MIRPLTVTLITLLSACGLAGCVESQRQVGADFGLAVRQDVAAQVANPDAVYRAAPRADGPRTALAIERYQTGKVIEPQATSTKVGPTLGASKGP